MPKDRASALFHRPELRRGLRVLNRLSRSPVLDLEQMQIQPPGYDATTRVFYDGPEATPRTDCRTPHLDKLLSGWTGLCESPYRSCSTDADIAHLYAAGFTEVLADSGIFTLHRHPLLRGNQKGLGKDKSGHALGVLRDGEAPVDLNHHDENRINQGFGNGIHEGRRIFTVTNIHTSKIYSNNMLARWLTSESLTGPKHGGGTWHISPNTATVVFTLNQGSIDNDLLDRLLPINLEETGDARKRRFAFDPVDYVREHRQEILEEVLGLALVCLRERREWSIPEGMDRRFERWVRFIGAMLEARGLSGFMSNLAVVGEEVDERSAELAELARKVRRSRGEEWLAAKDIVEFCRADNKCGGRGRGRR